MAICARLRQCLSAESAKYQLVLHRQEFGAQRVAASIHLPGRDMAKVVVVKDEAGEFLMLVVPSHAHVDLAATARTTGRAGLGLRLANEKELAELFPDCEVGAMPPFGHLYGLPTYVDGCLRGEPEIFFPGGNHHELVAMSVRDYLGVARPVIGQWCFHRRLEAA
jgi:Ala-tRNA(Pro) deacylase